MKNIALYLMLLITIPATAQHGLFGSHSHHHSNIYSHSRHHSNGPLLNQHHSSHSATVYAMDAEDFEVAFRFIAKETFDSKRLDLAKQIVRDNWMSAKQIASICELFTFDSNRLEFAKYAYRSCVNKGMYFILDETFTYRSSRDELHEFIKDW